MRRAAPAAAALALACASVPPDLSAERCTPDAAFERGLGDGGAGRPQDLGFLDPCGDAGPALGEAYREGHRLGLAERPPGDAPGGRSIACEVQARGETFRGRGPTAADAAGAARAACRERNPAALCRELTCRPGE